VSSPPLLVVIGLRVPPFFQIDYHRTNYGAFEQNIFQIKYTRDVESMIRDVESKQKDIRRWSMMIYINSTYQKRKICAMIF
jgi:hypothetical protein